MLSDWMGEAIRAFGIARDARGMLDIAARSVFLVHDAVIVESWLLETPLPDIDAIVAAAVD